MPLQASGLLLFTFVLERKRLALVRKEYAKTLYSRRIPVWSLDGVHVL